MRELSQAEIAAWIDGAETAARKLKEAIVDEEIYVAARIATSSIPYSHLTKAFQIHEAVLVLSRAGFGAEAIALSRSILEMYITLRWIINQDQSKRAEEFALFVAKRKEYVANTFAKYQPGNPVAVDAVKFASAESGARGKRISSRVPIIHFGVTQPPQRTIECRPREVLSLLAERKQRDSISNHHLRAHTPPRCSRRRDRPGGAITLFSL